MTRQQKLLILSVTLLMLAPASVLASSSKSGDSWLQLQRAGTEALDANKYWIAEPTLKEAVIKAGSFGDHDLRLAKSLGELGRLYTIRGRFDEAEPYLEEELHVKQLALGQDKNGELVPAMASLIKFYLNYGTASKANPLAEDMLTFVTGKMKEPGAHNHGKIILKKGQPLEGWAGEAAPVVRDPFIEWAIACDAAADAYKAHEKYDYADRLYKAALDLKTTVLGKEHLSLANSYDSLGALCMERNELREAEGYFEDSLDMTERILAPDNPQVYARLDKLARCLLKEGKTKEAEELYKRAQGFWKDEPCNNGDQARAAYALGNLYLEQKNFEAAAPVLEHALHLAEDVNGPTSYALVPYLQRYAYSLYYLNRKPEWEELKARASTISGIVD